MSESLEPTPFTDISEVLSALQGRIEAVLGAHLIGIYIVGSLAVGDFNPSISDIDIIVVTDETLEEPLVQSLREMHEQFARSPSPWAKKLEAIYAPRAALRVEYQPLPGKVPQLEKGTTLFSAPLEEGWVFQCWTLRDCGLIVCGPPPERLGILTERKAMAEAVRAVAAQWLHEWLHDATNDPTWLEWLRERENQLFVVQTLCRLLYSLKTGEVSSKPRSLVWGQQALGEPWAALVAQTARGQPERLGGEAVAATLAFILYMHEAGQRSSGRG